MLVEFDPGEFEVEFEACIIGGQSMIQTPTWGPSNGISRFSTYPNHPPNERASPSSHPSATQWLPRLSSSGQNNSGWLPRQYGYQNPIQYSGRLQQTGSTLYIPPDVNISPGQQGGMLINPKVPPHNHHTQVERLMVEFGENRHWVEKKRGERIWAVTSTTETALPAPSISNLYPVWRPWGVEERTKKNSSFCIDDKKERTSIDSKKHNLSGDSTNVKGHLEDEQ